MNVYTYTDASSQAHSVPAYQDFTSLVQRIDNAEESAFTLGAEIGSYVPCEVQHRYADLDSYNDALLARWGITRTVLADPVPPEPGPPLVVSRMQLRRQLLRMARTDAGTGPLLDQIDATVAAAKASGTPEGRDLSEYWTQTSEFHRDHPTLIAFAASQGIGEADLAAAFAAAVLLA